ncbi:hypothetical protein ABK040_015369 [Willaertia magna]
MIESDTLEFDESFEEAKKIKEIYFSTNMDKFINFFTENNFTIPTESFKLTVNQEKALLHLCKVVKKQTTLFNENLLQNTLPNSNELNNLQKNTLQNYLKNLNENDEKEILEIIKLINQKTTILKQNYNLTDNNGFIVKLTSRSPKDITPTHPKTLNLYSEYLQTLFNIDHYNNNCKNNNYNNTTENELLNLHLSSLYFASLNCMKIQNAEEAILLLVKRIIVRPWDNEMRLDSEFRGIIYNNKLKALSQYFTQCYLKEVCDNQEKIMTLCQSFFNNCIKPILEKNVKELKNYIIDFSVNVKTGIVKLLEINPYLETTGVGLFNWEEDRERLFENENAKFEFRILKEPIVTKLLGKGLVVKEWEEIIKNL